MPLSFLIIIISSLSLLIRLILGEFMCHKPSLDSLPSEFNVTSVFFDRFYDILLTITEFLHIPEHAFLTYYLFQFYNSWNDSPALIPVKDFKKSTRNLMVAVGIIFIPLAILLHILKIVFIYELQNLISPHEQCDHAIICLDYIYHTISIFKKIIIVLVRLMMMYFTLMIRRIWKMEGSNKQNASSQYCNQEHEVRINIENEREWEKYDIVAPIYKIFQSFFVFQLIIHLFGFIFHCTHLTRSWIQHGREIVIDPSLLAIVILYRFYQFLHLIFDCFALIVAHMCAVKMNYYAKQYVENLEQDQQFKGDPYFTPEIPEIGIDIPIRNSGFVFNLVFGVFGMLLTFIFL